MPNNTTPDGQTLPLSLKLVFTKAANGSAVHRMFDPAIKSKIDPQDYVVKRESKTFEKQINGGHGTLLVDKNGEPFALTMAWHTVANDNKGKPQHIYTETGTTLTRLPGFHSAQAVVAALVLHQWWNHNPKKKIAAEILKENIPSRKLFEETFRWRTIANPATAKKINDLCNGNVVEDNNGGKPFSWYTCEKETLTYLAKSLLTMMDRGTLNRKDGATIALDLSELDKVGLTRARLEALAGGTTSKRELKKLAP